VVSCKHVAPGIDYDFLDVEVAGDLLVTTGAREDVLH
jgi:hypothetical protein